MDEVIGCQPSRTSLMETKKVSVGIAEERLKASRFPAVALDYLRNVLWLNTADERTTNFAPFFDLFLTLFKIFYNTFYTMPWSPSITLYDIIIVSCVKGILNTSNLSHPIIPYRNWITKRILSLNKWISVFSNIFYLITQCLAGYFDRIIRLAQTLGLDEPRKMTKERAALFNNTAARRMQQDRNA